MAGYGWQAWTGASSSAAPVTVDERHLANGIVTVEVDPADGTFAIDGLAGLGRLVDGGDFGDSYNWCPPLTDTIVDTPTAVSHPCRRGRSRARPARDPPHLRAAHPTSRRGTRRLAQPWRCARRSSCTPATTWCASTSSSTTTACATTACASTCRCPERATASVAECAFATVERGLVAEGGPTEQGLATYPSRRFVVAGGLTVAHEGLLEYELVDLDEDVATAGELAITLVRSTGMLSQGPMATRALPAGPLTPMEGTQSQFPVEARFALHLGGRDPYAVADDAFLPLLVTRGGGEAAPGAPDRPGPGRRPGPR